MIGDNMLYDILVTLQSLVKIMEKIEQYLFEIANNSHS